MLRRFWGSLLAFLAMGVLSAQDGAVLLAKVDRLRQPWSAFSVEVGLESGRIKQRWRVIVGDKGEARVEGLSERERGRTVLLLGERMWMLLPKAKRPVPVTPQQRLLGPASGGDLARSRFADDYEVTGSQEERLDGSSCTRLDLRARKPSLSWRTARLWVGADGRPLQGEFYLPSGKLARSVVFDPPVQLAGVQVVPGFRLIEPKGAETRLRFEHWSPGPQNPELFRLPETP